MSYSCPGLPELTLSDEERARGKQELGRSRVT